MFKAAKLLIFILVVTALPNVLRGDVVLHYTGQSFTDFTGSAFDGSDQITGTVTFNAIGDTAAKAISLSTTLSGSPGYTFLISDVDSPPAGITVNSNSFTWDSSLPTTWDLLVYGNLNSSTGDEQIAISDFFGDQAYINLSESNESSGATGFGRIGEWSVVPEPSSLALATLGIGCALFGLWRKRPNHSRT